MGIYLNPDNRMFQVMLDSLFYVDKTRLVSFMNERIGRDDRFVCVSRPRRFGKSVDADMLVAYYSRGCDSRIQFERLDVAQDPSFERHLNAHDVIKIDVQRLVQRGGGIERVIESVTRAVIRDLHKVYASVVPENATSLAEVLELIYEEHGTRFIFVIDEWDCVFRLDPDNTVLQRSYLDFLRDLFKGAPYVDAAYMTGILPIKKYGQHSALNLFTE